VQQGTLALMVLKPSRIGRLVLFHLRTHRSGANNSVFASRSTASGARGVAASLVPFRLPRTRDSPNNRWLDAALGSPRLNHLSYLDIIVLSSIRPCVFVAKRDVAGWPLFGWLARAAGTLFVDRRRRLDDARIVSRIKDVIQAGSLVVLFPEGTSSDGATVLPFKPSLLEAVAQLRCQTTAASIDYLLPHGSVAEEVCYWRDMTLLPHLFNLFTKATIQSKVSFATSKLRGGNRKEIARELHGKIMSMRSQ
jgi:1-acyl-sn-glycerol-3-phosphate acyltransferase